MFLIDQQQKCGCHQIGQQRDQKTGHPQIRACDGRKIVVIGFLHHIENRGGQYHGRRGIVHQYHDISLQHLGSGGIRPFRILEFRKRVVPLSLIETLCQRLLVHGQGIHPDILDFLPDFLQKSSIHSLLHITECNVRPGTYPRAQHFHMQVRASDSAADKSRVGHQGLHKAILGTPERLILLRLFHPPGWICPGINEKRFLVTVYQQHKYSRQQGMNHHIPLVVQIHFHIRRKLLGQTMHVPGHFVRRQIHEILQKLLHQFILTETIYQIHTRFPAADMDDPVDHVKILPYIQHTVQICHICLQGTLDPAGSGRLALRSFCRL